MGPRAKSEDDIDASQGFRAYDSAPGGTVAAGSASPAAAPDDGLDRLRKVSEHDLNAPHSFPVTSSIDCSARSPRRRCRSRAAIVFANPGSSSESQVR